jgi:hypothetical protein
MRMGRAQPTRRPLNADASRWQGIEAPAVLCGTDGNCKPIHRPHEFGMLSEKAAQNIARRDSTRDRLGNERLFQS